jgi:hypothetical protein
METRKMTRTASCSCGQLSAIALGEPIRVSICHCLACQRRTGSVFGVQARFARDKVEIRGTSTAFVRIGDSGNKATFNFCPLCGATVHYTIEGQSDIVGIPVGAFGDPGFPFPVRSVYEERMHAWVRVPPDVEHLP